MSKDIIYREDAIGAINGWLKRNHFSEIGDGILYLVPSADRPQGKWIEMYRNGFGNMICMCSKCNFHATKSNFCPNCGADMREGADDEN